MFSPLRASHWYFYFYLFGIYLSSLTMTTSKQVSALGTMSQSGAPASGCDGSQAMPHDCNNCNSYYTIIIIHRVHGTLWVLYTYGPTVPVDPLYSCSAGRTLSSSHPYYKPLPCTSQRTNTSGYTLEWSPVKPISRSLQWHTCWQPQSPYAHLRLQGP